MADHIDDIERLRRYKTGFHASWRGIGTDAASTLSTSTPGFANDEVVALIRIESPVRVTNPAGDRFARARNLRLGGVEGELSAETPGGDQRPFPARPHSQPMMASTATKRATTATGYYESACA